MIKIIYSNVETHEQVEVWVEHDLLETVIAALVRSGCTIMEVRRAP